jgi:hypothetical protein
MLYGIKYLNLTQNIGQKRIQPGSILCDCQKTGNKAMLQAAEIA